MKNDLVRVTAYLRPEDAKRLRILLAISSGEKKKTFGEWISQVIREKIDKQYSDKETK